MSAPTRQEAEALCQHWRSGRCLCDAIHAALTAAYERGAIQTLAFFEGIVPRHAFSTAVADRLETWIEQHEQKERKKGWLAGRDAAAKLARAFCGNPFCKDDGECVATHIAGEIRALEPPGEKS